MKRNWKRLLPHNLRDAFRLCKEHGIAEKRLSVERLAELMGKTPDWVYKVMADGSMPANLIPMFETITGADYVSRHLAVSAGKLVIEAPVGRACDAVDMQTLQEILNAAVGQLLAFHAGKTESDAVIASVTEAMQKLAWHRQNAADRQQPSLDLGGAA
jgi:hypothetical protein